MLSRITVVESSFFRDTIAVGSMPYAERVMARTPNRVRNEALMEETL